MLIRPVSGFPYISHVGVVVPDLRWALRQHSEVFGWGPWEVFRRRAPILHETTVRGEPVELAFDLAETTLDGGVGFELLQPVAGPTIYREWLDAGGTGLHHLGCIFTDRGAYERATARLLAEGGESVMTGKVGEGVDFHYIASASPSGVLLETAFSAGIDIADSIYPPSVEATRP